MSPPPRKAPDLARTAAVYSAASLALVLTSSPWTPHFSFLHDPARLLVWLLYATLLMAALPAVAFRLAFRRPFADAGLDFGDSRRDALPIAACVLLALATAFALSRLPGVRAHYPVHAFVRTAPILWIPSTLLFACYGLAQEALFRGFLVLGVSRALGPLALLLQTALYALAHAGKPPVEVALSIPAGLVLGLAALRTRSIWPGFLVHFALSTGVNLFCVFA